MSNATLLRAVLPRIGSGAFSSDDGGGHVMSAQETLRNAMQKFYARCVWQEMAERRWHRVETARLLGHPAASDDVRSVAVQLLQERQRRLAD